MELLILDHCVGGSLRDDVQDSLSQFIDGSSLYLTHHQHQKTHGGFKISFSFPIIFYGDIAISQKNKNLPSFISDHLLFCGIC
jgi:hypothetical protein